MIISPIIPILIMLFIAIILVILIIKSKDNFITRILIIVLLFIINLRPMIPSSDVLVVSNSLDVLFVIDNTISMVAEDYNGKTPRFTAIKKDCEYIINELNGARFSVITFANTSQIMVPYTKDSEMITDIIDTMKVTDNLYAKGSSLNVPLEDMLNVLKMANEKEDRQSILFYISDGEITNEDTLKSYSAVKEYIDDGAILGYGTTSGGYMKTKSSYEGYEAYEGYEEYIEDYTQDYPWPKAVSKIDENNLKKIAQDIKIDYIHMERQSDINYKIREIKESISNQATDEQYKNSYADIYYLFVIPLVGLLFYELFCYKKKI